MTPLIAILAGFAVGGTLGAVGAGGSILTIPVLVYALGVDIHDAAGTSLAIVGVNALVGVALHGRAKAVAWREGLAFGALAAVGAFAGAIVNGHMPALVLLGGLAVLMVLAAVQMWRGRHRPVTGSARRALPAVAAAGLGTGFLTGFFGVGGGFVVVPALVLVLGLSMPLAVGTSLLVIAISAVAGIGPYLAAGRVDFAVGGLFIAGGVLGIAAGTVAGRHASPARLREAFAVILIVVAVSLLAREGVALTA